MGRFEDMAAAIMRRLDEIESDVQRLGAEADEAAGGGPTDPPPGEPAQWLPEALPLPSLPGDPTPPALIGWHDVVSATASQTGVKFSEFKANADLVIHQSGMETLIEREHRDRFLVDDDLDGWSVLAGEAGYARRDQGQTAVQLHFQRSTQFALLLEGGAQLQHADLIRDPRVSDFGGFDVRVRRGTSYRYYRALRFEVAGAGWIDAMGLKNTGALFYAVLVNEGRESFVAHPPTSDLHSTYGQKVRFLGELLAAWHPIIDPRGDAHDHEHGYLTRPELLPWNVSDRTADKAGFKGIEFAQSAILEFDAPGYSAVVPQILVDFQTSSRRRIEQPFATLDHAVWGVPQGNDLADYAAWEPIAMLPFVAQFGSPQAVYGGQREYKMIGSGLGVATSGSRNITVALPDPIRRVYFVRVTDLRPHPSHTITIPPGATSVKVAEDREGWHYPLSVVFPADANPGYEERRPSLEMADGIPIDGPIVLITDDPVTRLPGRPPNASLVYGYNPAEALHKVPRSRTNGTGARRWLIWPDFELGKRYRIEADLMKSRFGLEAHPETGMYHWIVTKEGAFVRPFDPYRDAAPDIEVETPCFILPGLRVVFDGGSGKAYREKFADQYHVFGGRGNHIPRIPLDYGLASQERN